MSYKHYCVIDDKGTYKDVVLALTDADGVESIQAYTLLDGERLLDAAPPAGYVRPYWDGTAWAEAATTEEIETADTRTLEEARADKLAELSASANAVIVAGCDVTLAGGNTEHFSLTEADQIHLTTATAAVEAGAAGYPYHADGALCKIYLAADIIAIGTAAITHKLYHTTYCNHAMTWARRAEAKTELDSIYYGGPLPDDLTANMEAVLNAAGG